MVFYISQIGANNYESTLVPSYYTITLIAATTNGNNNRILTDYIDGTGTAIKVVNEQDTVIKDVITIIKYVYNN